MQGKGMISYDPIALKKQVEQRTEQLNRELLERTTAQKSLKNTKRLVKNVGHACCLTLTKIECTCIKHPIIRSETLHAKNENCRLGMPSEPYWGNK